MKGAWLLVGHSLGLAWYAFLVHSIRHLSLKGTEKPSDLLVYGGQWKFLTVLNLVLQAIFYGVSMLSDAFVLMKKHRIAKSVFPIRDLLFGGLAFPLSMAAKSLGLVLDPKDHKLENTSLSRVTLHRSSLYAIAAQSKGAAAHIYQFLIACPSTGCILKT